MIEIVLKGKLLSTQSLYGRGKRVYMKKKGKKLKQSYMIQTNIQYKGEILSCDLYCVVDLFFQDKRKRDRDNYHKISMDALEGRVYKDDKQIKKVMVTKRLDRNNPRIEIRIFKDKKKMLQYCQKNI